MFKFFSHHYSYVFFKKTFFNLKNELLNNIESFQKQARKKPRQNEQICFPNICCFFHFVGCCCFVFLWNI